MARPTNTVASTSMTISVAPQIRHYLLELTSKGTFGNTPQEVARTLIATSIQRLISEKALDERKWRVLEDGTVDLVPV